MTSKNTKFTKFNLYRTYISVKTTFKILDSYAELLFSVLKSCSISNGIKNEYFVIHFCLEDVVRQLPDIIYNHSPSELSSSITTSVINLVKIISKENYYKKEFLNILLYPLHLKNSGLKEGPELNKSQLVAVANKMLETIKFNSKTVQFFIYSTLNYDVDRYKLSSQDYDQFTRSIERYISDPEIREYRKFDLTAIFLAICFNSCYHKNNNLSCEDLSILNQVLKAVNTFQD